MDWISASQIIHYQTEHQSLLDEEVAPILQIALPHDIVMNNVLPFLELPSYTFEIEDLDIEEDGSVNEEEVEDED